MPIPVSVTTAIRNYFSTMTSISSRSQIKSDGNKYELYVYCLTYEALSRNFTLTVRSLDGVGKFKFKCGTGPINNAYSYFEFSDIKGNVYELRNGIDLIGHVLEHEIDICVLIHDLNMGYANYPSHHCLKIALECKLYSNPNNLKGEARKYLGLMTDMSSLAQLPPNGIRNVGCVHLDFNFFRSFVTNVKSNQRQDIQDFLSAYILYPQFGVMPFTLEEQDFLDRIENYSSNW